MNTNDMPRADESASVEFPMLTPSTVYIAAMRPSPMAVSMTTAMVAPGLITSAAEMVA